MVVSELIAHLESLPGDAHVDAMFPKGAEAFAVVGVDSVTLNDGRVIAIVDITDGPALSVA
jgi:copper chaperone CopZ